MGAGQQWLFKKGPPELVAKVLFHPVQVATVTAIEEMVGRLHNLKTAEDCYALQRDLLNRIYEVERVEAQATRKLRADPGDPDARVEQFAAGRATRQLRVIGDGLAWQVMGGQRAAIVALSQNQSAGRVYEKGTGLESELAALNNYWRQGHFALLHDLTNSLRIDDLTVVYRLHRSDPPQHECPALAYAITEVKTSRKKKPSSRQKQRRQQALSAINDVGPIVGTTGTTSQQFRTNIPYESHEGVLAEILAEAMADGVAGGVLEDGWAASALRWVNPEGHTGDPEAVKTAMAWESRHRHVLDEAGVRDLTWAVQTGDSAGRMAKCIPFSIYEVSPKTAAWLICDWLVFKSTLSIDRLDNKLQRLGITTETTLGSPPMITASRDGHAIGITRSAFEPALIEVTKLDVMAKAFGEWFAGPSFKGTGELIFP